ncbi:hypothetical protein MKX01_039772 [Papaver californicum]|nr:hypothetical protein MKX01_039772 [Papaver californicum]
MAMSRIGRSNLKQSGKAIRSFMTERSIPLTEVEGSALLSPSSLQTLTPRSNNTKNVSSIVQMNQMTYGLRGINILHSTTSSSRQKGSRKILSQSLTIGDYLVWKQLKQVKKLRVVFLGTEWASCRFLKGLDTSIYDVVCISPRNHMVFTPLLASTCVGTLEFRSMAEPIRRIQSASSTAPNSHFYLANCLKIDSDSHEVYCETVSNRGLPNEHGLPKEPYRFKVAYDKLHAFFLRKVNNAQEIRKRLLLNLMKADNPGLPVEEKKRLLHCVVVVGGPTGVEFSGELSDSIIKDANEILSWFDVRLREYATNQLTKVVEILIFHPVILVSMIGIDQWMRVPSVEDVFPIGDCAGFLEESGKQVLPALAQMAEREGKFLVNLFNNIGKQNGGKAFSAKNITLGEPFVYKHLGSMHPWVVIKRWSLYGISHGRFVSWLIWRSAYLTRVISWRNRFYVAVNWATTLVFGRDNSRIG